MASDMVRINMGVSASFASSEHREIVEVPRAEWDAMDADERRDYLNSLADTLVQNYVDAWAYVEDGD